MHDLRFAIRSLLKSPGFTLVAVLTIAVGIGANTTLFSVFNSVVLHPLSLPHPETAVQLWSTNPRSNFYTPAAAWPRYEELCKQQDVFSSVAAATFASFNYTGNGDPEQLQGQLVTASFFPTLEIRPERGRNFSAEEDAPDGPPVALISHEFWQGRLGGREDVLGTILMLNGIPHTVIGVLPPNLTNPFATTQVFAPHPDRLPFLTPVQVQNGAVYLQLEARLKPGVSLAQAQMAIDTLTRRYRAAYPTHLDAQNDLQARFLTDALVGNLRPTFYLLLCTVGFVLLIACANVTGLFLGRLSARRKEVAVRLSLGATRGQLVRQFLVESLVFSVIAGGLGILASLWSLSALQQLASNLLPVNVQLRVDGPTLLFTCLISALVAIFVGVVPAWQASATQVGDVLRDTSRGQSGARGSRFRSLLIVAEVALSVVLLIGSSLLLMSFLRLQATPPGFSPRGVASAFVNIPNDRYRTPAQQADFFRQVVERLQAIPLIRAATACVGLPLSGFTPVSPYAVGGRPVPPLPERPLANLCIVSADYFATLGIPVRSGRIFSDHDREGAPKVCILNESFARRLFSGESALGRTMLRGKDAEIGCEIVGVVADVLSAGLNAPSPDTLYYPMAQLGTAGMTIVARTDQDPAALQSVIRTAVASVDPVQPIAFFSTMDSLLANSFGFQRVVALLTTVFAGVALALAVVGVYSVLAYAVTQRTTEIGIRMALGAQRGQVIRLVLSQGMWLVAIGLAVGLVAAAVAAHLIRSLLFSVTPHEPLVFSGVAVVFAAIAALACLVPSLRAARVDPIVALRAE